MNTQHDNKQSLTKKTLIYLAGNFSSRIFSVIIIPIYANYLRASELGEYDFQITIANLLMPIIGLAIWESVLRFGLNTEEKEKKIIFSTASIISSFTLISSFFILFFLYSVLYGFNILSFLYVSMIILMPIVSILGYMTRAVKANKIYAFSGVFSSFINIICIIIFVVTMKLGIYGLLLSTVISNIFNSIFLLFRANLISYLKFSFFDWSMGKKLLKFSLPLIFNLAFGWFINSFSRFYINVSIGSTANGIYAFGSKFSNILLQFASIVNMTIIEDAIITSESTNFVPRFENNIKNITSLFFNVCYILMPAISIYYNFVSNEDFKSSLILIPILLIVAILNNTSTLIGNVFPVFNETSKAFLTSLIGGISNIVFSIILGYFFGLIGICLAQLTSSAILVISRYYFGTRIVAYNVNWIKYLGNILMFLLISFFSVLSNFTTQILILLLTVIFLLINYRKWILHKINTHVINK